MEVTVEQKALERDAYHKVAFAFFAGTKMSPEKERILAELRNKWGICERGISKAKERSI